MFTFILDAFCCFALTVLVLAAFSLHVSIIHETDVPGSVVVYTSAASLIGWSGNIGFFIKYSLPVYAILVAGAQYYELLYTTITLACIFGGSVFLMLMMKMLSPHVKALR